ncbi:MAG: zinc-ribbon domain-containing protein, partial [Clostridia bacterium]|nr:zinc-ribbon domain-containing protein [Clostridia bacterium]
CGAANVKKCPDCGKETSEAAKFCTDCGKNI